MHRIQNLDRTCLLFAVFGRSSAWLKLRVRDKCVKSWRNCQGLVCCNNVVGFILNI